MKVKQEIEKQGFPEKSKNLWSQYYRRKISTQEEDEIRKNVFKLIEALHEIHLESEEIRS